MISALLSALFWFGIGVFSLILWCLLAYFTAKMLRLGYLSGQDDFKSFREFQEKQKEQRKNNGT